MLPTLAPGDTVLVWCFGKVRLDDIVVFKHDGKFLIKRVKEVEGDRYFVTGDNAEKSIDSRSLGWINRFQILGAVKVRLPRGPQRR